MQKSVLQINSHYMCVYVLVGSMCVDICVIYTVCYLISDFVKIIGLIFMVNWCGLRIIHFHLCE